MKKEEKENDDNEEDPYEKKFFQVFLFLLLLFLFWLIGIDITSTCLSLVAWFVIVFFYQILLWNSRIFFLSCAREFESINSCNCTFVV
jgi:hypothetical protein